MHEHGRTEMFDFKSIKERMPFAKPRTGRVNGEDALRLHLHSLASGGGVQAVREGVIWKKRKEGEERD